jgi:hypothetical protein
LKTPPKLPMGVRHALRMMAGSMGGFLPASRG